MKNKRFVRSSSAMKSRVDFKPDFRKSLDEVAKKLEFKSLNDWYDMTTRKVIANGGKRVIQAYKSSLISALKDLYSEKEWDIFQFKSLPHKYWQNKENQLFFLENIKKQLKINKEEDWYNIYSQDIKKLGGKSLLNIHQNLYQLLKTNYPNYQWKVWKFSEVTKHFWSSIENQRSFLDDFYRENCFERMEDWYSVQGSQIKKFGGTSLLNIYNGSVSKILSTVYENYEWDLAKFNQFPLHHWSSIDNQRGHMEIMYRSLSLCCFNDWYSVTLEQLRLNKGGSLLRKYNSSLYHLFQNIYPNYPWEVHLFKRVPKNWWKNSAHLRNYLDQISHSFGIKKIEDWYSISYKQFKDKGGWGANSILEHYSNIFCALTVAYPELNIFSFNRFPQRFFGSEQNQITFLQLFAKKKNILQPSDWKRVTSSDISLAGGDALLQKYNFNLFECLSHLYPTTFHNQFISSDRLPSNDTVIFDNVNNNYNNHNNHIKNLKFIYNNFNERIDLKISRFSVTAKKKFWNEKENIRKLFAMIISQYKIQKKVDWQRISFGNMKNLMGNPFLNSSQSTFPDLLSHFYPDEFSSDFHPLSSTKRSTQFYLFVQLRNIFPNMKIIEEYKPTHLFFPKSRCKIELDFFIPNLNIGVEYQGLQHYEELHNFGPSSLYQERDQKKMEICIENSLHLLIVPYWWDQSLFSLQMSLRKLPILNK